MFSGVCSVIGGTWLSLVQPNVIPAVVVAVYTLASVALLRALCADLGARYDERIISAIAILGRGMVMALITSDCVVTAGWGPFARGALLLILLVVSLGQARSMVKVGPTGYLLQPTAISPDPEEAPLVDHLSVG